MFSPSRCSPSPVPPEDLLTSPDVPPFKLQDLSPVKTFVPPQDLPSAKLKSPGSMMSTPSSAAATCSIPVLLGSSAPPSWNICAFQSQLRDDRPPFRSQTFNSSPCYFHDNVVECLEFPTAPVACQESIGGVNLFGTKRRGFFTWPHLWWRS
ncbi:hypothetical protein B0H12DRAFT_1147464 [Mycena haematopus]|nr:hypothetical protein B0H12DRAFT_1147464 [Mycena haematopus]